jgi:hypothetical protein
MSLINHRENDDGGAVLRSMVFSARYRPERSNSPYGQIGLADSYSSHHYLSVANQRSQSSGATTRPANDCRILWIFQSSPQRPSGDDDLLGRTVGYTWCCIVCLACLLVFQLSKESYTHNQVWSGADSDW